MFRRSKAASARAPQHSAEDWVAKGAELLDTDLEAAERCYRKGLELDPSMSAAWFDLGLIAKWRHEWADCITFNRRASSLR